MSISHHTFLLTAMDKTSPNCVNPAYLETMINPRERETISHVHYANNPDGMSRDHFDVTMASRQSFLNNHGYTGVPLYAINGAWLDHERLKAEALRNRKMAKANQVNNDQR